jgi:predicted nucleic acid-binding protein
MSAVFLDTGYILALELKQDQHHAAAQQHWQRIRTALPQIVTTTYVLDEVVTYLNSRGHHAKAVQVGNNLLQSPSVQLVHVDTALFQEGWAYF